VEDPESVAPSSDTNLTTSLVSRGSTGSPRGEA